MAQIQESPRRSGRKRQSNKKYTNDLFEVVDLLGSPEDEFVVPVESEDDYAEADDVEAEDEDVNESLLSAGASDDEDSDAAGQVDDDLTEIIGDEVDRIPRVDTGAALNRIHTVNVNRLNFRKESVAEEADSELHSRGLGPFGKTSSRDLSISSMVGVVDEDVRPFASAGDKWMSDMTLPSRRCDQHGRGGMSLSLYQPREARLRLECDGWDWYYEGLGRRNLDRWQRLEKMEPKAAGNQPETKSSAKFVAGPADNQRLFNLGPRESFKIMNAWNSNAPVNGWTPVARPMYDERRAWILNMGQHVQCLEWVPHQNESTQFLAVSFLPQRSSASSESNAGQSGPDTANAFVPDTSMTSSIEIWRFESSGGGVDLAANIDEDSPPRLDLVLHSDCGHVRDLKWNNSPRQPGMAQSDPATRHLGLLATVHSDGAVRVVDLSIPRSDTSSRPTPTHVTLAHAAFTSRPPGTVCTSLTWLSPCLLAAGCANGHICIWDLSTHLSNPHPPANALPTIYTSLHTSYIVSLTACTPSRPNLLVTSCIDGHNRLTDLRALHADSAFSQRSRISSSPLSWHDHIHHVLSTDESHCVRMSPLRSFLHSLALMRYASHVLCIDSSPVHASVAVGTADGAVTVVNPVRKLWRGRGRMQVWREKVVGHEWRRGRPNRDPTTKSGGEAKGDGQGSADSELDFPEGLTRLTTGYALENVSLAMQTPGAEEKKARGQPGAASAPPPTIHEEKTGVKCVAWNPNLRAGGWLAAGFGDGLVWVEDVARD